MGIGVLVIALTAVTAVADALTLPLRILLGQVTFTFLDSVLP